MFRRKTQYSLGQRPLGQLLYRVIWVIIMDLSPENDGQRTWVWTLNYCHLLLNPFPRGPTLEMVFTEWDIWQVKSSTRFISLLCQKCHLLSCKIKNVELYKLIKHCLSQFPQSKYGYITKLFIFELICLNFVLI